ncbi:MULTISPECIES: NAD(P)-dependent alcohol dehydrogenase [Paraburkholderia]|uniref:NAD(P)-dependent alcohol dehydrogenase n=1 Tax=Paraburkholderia podalyriae TaxID=1938811 RepID=A0ABR7Q0N1_9BURK|nr:NAD(P)-dependent alcohol dehydrogenase [Paraburkholderia podalyriae]MBC8752099.1 NAD(P)-dependent alcohol dehydrogenase [Paraburkholderia podalyriae]
MEIKAAIVKEKSGRFSVETVTLSDPRPDEVLVRIVGSGVCHTDLVVRDQYVPIPLPIVLGHEGAGVVESVGRDVTRFRKGDRVVLSYHSCGHCPSCEEGAPAYCDHLMANNFSGKRVDGSPSITLAGKEISANFFQQSSFATHALATSRNVVKVPDSVSLEDLPLYGPFGCGIQTGAGAVLNTLNPRAGTSIVVFGAGSVGLSAVMAARLAGCTTIVAVDLNQARLDLALTLGATHVVNGKADDPVDFVRSITGGRGADYSLETTAVPRVLRQSVECLHARGVCGSIGLPPAGTEVTLDMLSILFGRTLRGIIEGDSVPTIFINRLIALHQQGRFPVDRIMTHYRFDEINKAVEETEKGHAIKAVLHME